MKKLKYLIIIALFVINYSAFSQELITDRPDQTESSSTVTKGSLQIESGLLLGFSESNSISHREISAPTTLFRLGLTEGIEIRVSNQYENIKNQTTKEEISGISDLELGTKIQILKQEGLNIEIAFLSHALIPTGSKNLTNDKFGSINKLAVSHSINEDVGIGYNIGYNYFGRGDGDLTYSLALGFAISSKAGIYIETYGDYIEFKNHESNFDAGLTYLIKDNLQLDFSFGSGVNHTMNYIAVGFSWNIFEEVKFR